MVYVWHFICLSAFTNLPCLGQDSIDASYDHTEFSTTNLDETLEDTTPNGRRYWLASALDEKPINENDEEKDENLKLKITTLVEQTIYDTEQKINSVKPLKDQHREQAPYKAGFILSLIKKSKDVLNELFNVAIRHKNDWKALEQLKVFELIVHTNVDTTNLVRQLVEIHIQHMNATNTGENRKRVVLLK
ncbi:unnamed protein product [Pieris brassicae]|uniref:Uncharacterized protein n=1 Tax=Pieris brassicae TaxID=7116 RepID=A0A9P0T7S6_PIEBR|nr:unnamed protein product [Pieris brassicae]